MAAAEASVSRGGRLVRLAHGCEQRGDAGERSGDHRAGRQWFAALGTEKSGGTRLICLSGSVNRPGVYEVSMKTTVRDLIYDAELGQGMPPGRTVKAVIPGGTSAPV